MHVNITAELFHHRKVTNNPPNHPMSTLIEELRERKAKAIIRAQQTADEEEKQKQEARRLSCIKMANELIVALPMQLKQAADDSDKGELKFLHDITGWHEEAVRSIYDYLTKEGILVREIPVHDIDVNRTVRQLWAFW